MTKKKFNKFEISAFACVVVIPALFICAVIVGAILSPSGQTPTQPEAQTAPVVATTEQPAQSVPQTIEDGCLGRTIETGVFVADTIETYAAAVESFRKRDVFGYAELATQKRLVVLPKNTTVLMLDKTVPNSDPPASRIRVIGNLQFVGTAGYALTDQIAPVSQAEALAQIRALAPQKPKKHHKTSPKIAMEPLPIPVPFYDDDKQVDQPMPPTAPSRFRIH